MSTHRHIRRAVAALAAVTAAAVLAACGSDAPTGHAPEEHGAPQEQADHNAADVTFAQGMIPHHRQAIEMAALAPDRASSQEVKDLAVAIEEAQDPEIATLSTWLAQWGEEVPEEGAGMDHSHHGASGMMTAQQLADLRAASGRAFDTAFLELMTAHHEGAVAMAETEQAEGAHQPALKMAESIVITQSAEIDQMRGLLGDG